VSVRRRVQRYANGKSSTRWIVDIEHKSSDGAITRVRRIPRVQSRVGAERLERELLSQLEAGRYKQAEAVTPVPTLAKFWASFFETHVLVNNKVSEQQTKQRIAQGHLLPRFGGRKLDAISAHDVELYKATMAQLGYKPKTINNHLTVLRTVLKTAVRWGLSPSAAEIRLLRNTPADVVYLDFLESQQLIAAAGEDWRPMVVIALNTGMRIGELLALHWSDVDLRQGRLRVSRNDWKGELGTPKSGRNRDLPLNKAAQEALRGLATTQFERVFCGADGRVLTYRQCNHALERICKQAGLKAIQWHALRHTFASHLVMKGVPLKAVQELLGHGTQAMTERYAHLTPDVRRTAVDILDDTAEARWAFRDRTHT
jgi:integrase